MLSPSTLVKKLKIACDKKINMKIYNKAQAYSLNIIYFCIRARTSYNEI